MGAPFDHIASVNDTNYTQRTIGQLQRAYVWSYIEKISPQLSGLDILELSCGSGDDAILFGSAGASLLATDVSEEMLKVTQQKVKQFSMQHRISSQYLDPENFDETLFNKKFDLIFSNFGVLNCISAPALELFFEKIPTLLNRNGRFVGVVMPRFCLWEAVYRFSTFYERAFRRSRAGSATVTRKGVSTHSRFYSPRQLVRWSKKNFVVVGKRPVGVVLPPSHMGAFFHDRPRLLSRLNKLENRFNSIDFLSSVADHFIIDLRLK